MFSSNLFGGASYARFVTNIFVFLALQLFISHLAWSQSYQTVSTSSLPFSIQIPDVTLNQGDSVEIIFLLGTEDEPVAHVLGFDLEIKLSPKAVFPETPITHVESSWLNASGHLEEDHRVDPAGGLLFLKALIEDGAGQTGKGEILRLTLISNEDGVLAKELISQADGGLIMVENVEMKRGLAQEAPSPLPNWKAYPNPCQETLWISLEDNQQGIARLFSLTGQPVAQTILQSGVKVPMNTSSLQPGVFVLQLTLENGTVTTSKIIVR